MNPSTVVIIATKGRPQQVSNLIDALALQTVPPERIVVSASDRDDIDHNRAIAKNVEIIFGPPGSSIQRNRALSLVRGKSDIVVFFDDDFIPSRYWIENIQILLSQEFNVVGVTGQVLADGVTVGGLDRSDGQSIVDNMDLSKKNNVATHSYRMKEKRSAYGCNMAFRAKSIEHLTFDERLVLYGWLEDQDFGIRAAANGGKMIWTDAVWGVHLGIRRGRVSGLRFGYSQVVNPWHLMKKGSITPANTYRNIFRALAANSLGSFFPNSHVDRRGRLRGNIIGVKDIISGRWAPERIAGL
jgi:GT2 family glycosyltransferase